MPLRTTVGQLLINDALPPEHRDYNRVLDKGGVANLLAAVATTSPEQYRDVSHKLSDVGRHVAYTTGGHSFTLANMRTPPEVERALAQIRTEVEQIRNDQNLPQDAKDAAIIELLGKHTQTMSKTTLEAAKAANNPLYRQLIGAGRGNASQLNSLLGADLMYEDHRGRPIPIPVLRSYSKGLRPSEYFAAAFGTRKGLVDLKHGTAAAGFLAKQLAQAAHRLVVTADDDKNPYDESTPRGLISTTDDPDNAGAYLAHPAGGYGRNTLLTPRILKEMRAKGIDQILVRSPTVGGPADGGVYSKDAGIRELGYTAPVGSYVGLTAAQAIAEPITQSSISSKHCLAAGTLVRMADWSVKRIEDIQVGDLVLGADMRANTFSSRVVNTYDNGPRECVRTTFDAGGTSPMELFSTVDHKVLVAGAGGMPCMLPAGMCCRRPAVVGVLPTYDIEVDNADHLFVLANGLIVSNSGGVAGAGAKAIGGFKLINALVQSPEVFPGGATYSQHDGRVTKVEAAPQGGHFVDVAGERHYVPHGLPVRVKPGDDVEAGDMLSEGELRPAEIVRHKGVGEARRLYAEHLTKTLRGMNITAHRRNAELLSRGLINHVRLTQEFDDWLPDDIVPYQTLEHQYTPRQGAQDATPRQSIGKYLERPVLHYTIGTKIRPSVAAQLEKFSIKKVTAHKDPPPFEPEMVRGMAQMSHDADWQTRFLGSYNQKSLLDAAHRGMTSDELGSSFVPALVSGETFGKVGPTVGWTPPNKSDVGIATDGR